HYVSHFAAFFIDAGTKRSVVESFNDLFIGTQTATFRQCSWLRSPAGTGPGAGTPPGGHEGRARRSNRVQIDTDGRTADPEQGPGGGDCRRRARRAGPPKQQGANRHGWEDGRPREGAIQTLGNDPSAGSPTETLLRLLLPLNDQV